MGGFPNPRDCSKCICPGGYGGRLCDERPSGCGEILTATSQGKTLQYTLGKRGSSLNDYEFCHFWIKAAKKGEKVQIRLKNVFSQFVSDGCTPGGVEIKAQRDQGLTGYRFCRQSNAFRAFLSEVDNVPVILYRDRGEISLACPICNNFSLKDKGTRSPSTSYELCVFACI
ncbi:unnamed protein product [Cylicocyclus nassatus]|uniref:CUB domain-containing protein n=1 Tax=Cylicocyclus nassatus TaxID=53992 RepID=A0AA36M2D3_CYLNA|nr:unnamed protein product [Cylicocyclus nassatus]